MATPKNEQIAKVIGLYPAQIEVIAGFNPRGPKDYGDVKGLRASIEKDGMIDPIHVSATKRKTEDGWPIYELREGHRRFKAAAGIGEGDFLMPALVVEGSEAQHLGRAIATGIHKKDLSMIERAESLVRLRAAYAAEGTEKKDSELAKELGVTQSHINDLDKLLTADKTTLDSVRKGTLSASSVIELLKQNEPDKVSKQVAKAVAKAAETGAAKVKTSDVEDVVTRKSKGASAPSTKAGIPETSGKPQRLTERAKIIGELVSLKDGLLLQDGEVNEVAMATLSAVIAHLHGQFELVDMMDIFFGDGSALPEIPEVDVEAAEPEANEPAVEAAPAPAPKAKKPATAPSEDAKAGPLAGGKKLKDVLNAADGGKPAPAKKAAAAKPAASTKPKAAAAPKAKAIVEDEDDDNESSLLDKIALSADENMDDFGDD